MRPEDLKRPHKWEEREPILCDRIFHVPDHYTGYEKFSFPNWQNEAVFGNALPVRLEYCSGNGSWIASQAKMDKASNWVAVERRFDRIRKIWSKIKNLDLNNLLAVAGEALRVTSYYFKEESVAEIFINFPDPWPKKRHAKNRLIQKPFISEMWRILKKEALITIVTDDQEYSKIILEEMSQVKGFESNFPKPYYVHELAGYGTSFFEELWRGKGKAIFYHQFVKRGNLDGICDPKMCVSPK